MADSCPESVNGIDRADIQPRTGLILHVALVAANAGNDILGIAREDLLPILRVTNPGAPHGDQVAGSLCQKALHMLRVVEAAYHLDLCLNSGVLHSPGIGNDQIVFPRRVKARGMTVHAGICTDLHHIHIRLHHLYKLDGFLLTHTGHLAADDDLQQDIRTGFLHRYALHHRHAAAIFQTSAEFVRSGIQVPVHEPGRHTAAVGQRNGRHLEAVPMEVTNPIPDILHHGLDLRFGDFLAFFGFFVLIPSHFSAYHVIAGRLIRANADTGHGAIEFNDFCNLGHIVFYRRVIPVKDGIAAYVPQRRFPLNFLFAEIGTDCNNCCTALCQILIIGDGIRRRIGFSTLQEMGDCIGGFHAVLYYILANDQWG